jgi:hypothetical protein
MTCKTLSFSTEYITGFLFRRKWCRDNYHELVQEVIFYMGQHSNWFDADR